MPVFVCFLILQLLFQYKLIFFSFCSCTRFMEVGGWNTLNTWLEMAREDNNEPLLGELLEVYLAMPVTVGLLKQNNAAKTIKQLSKAEKESKYLFVSLRSSILRTPLAMMRGALIFAMLLLAGYL